jgi:hypothetical protein
MDDGGRTTNDGQTTDDGQTTEGEGKRQKVKGKRGTTTDERRR